MRFVAIITVIMYVTVVGNYAALSEELAPVLAWLRSHATDNETVSALIITI